MFHDLGRADDLPLCHATSTQKLHVHASRHMVIWLAVWPRRPASPCRAHPCTPPLNSPSRPRPRPIIHGQKASHHSPPADRHRTTADATRHGGATRRRHGGEGVRSLLRPGAESKPSCVCMHPHRGLE